VASWLAAALPGYISKYDDLALLAHAIDEIGRNGSIITDSLHDALLQLCTRCRDIRLSDTHERTLTLLETGMTDREIATQRQISSRTIEDHKRKILETSGSSLEASHQGFAQLTHDLGIRPGDLINDQAGNRPARALIARVMPWRQGTTTAKRRWLQR